MSIASSFASAQPHPASSPDRLAWWQDAKFGLFIHWGPVSVEGTEIGWSRNAPRRGYWQGGGSVSPERYDLLYREFNPTRFDPNEWAEIAKAAGMRYVVLTTRHHDGFSLWDTAANDYKITSKESPYRRDVVAMLAEATRGAGLRFGAYYSQPDWRHPDAFTENHHAYRDYLMLQVRELMSNYGRIDVLWFDGLGKSAEDYGAVEMHRMVRELQPHILINDRNGLKEDFDTPEQRVGTMQLDRPWESCITLCRQWAWKPNDQMKSLEECLHFLISTVTGGGNLLLNVGPMPDGRIEPRQVERLREIGAWLERHGDAIYNTKGGPFRNGSWGGSTHRGREVFLHLLQAPVAGVLNLPTPTVRVLSAHFHGTSEALAFNQDANGLRIQVGDRFRAPATLLRLELEAPLPDGTVLGFAEGPFENKALYGSRLAASDFTATATGDVGFQEDGRLRVKSQRERNAALTFDLKGMREITAVFASALEHNAFDSNSELLIELSQDGEAWTEVYRGSYGLPRWEVPVTQFIAGIQHPGREARLLRIRLESSGHESLRLADVSLYAR